jgi:hypothetical protein
MMLTAERTYTEGIKCMGPKETQQMYIRTCIDRSVIVALSAEPPGVNELCVCVPFPSSPRITLYHYNMAHVLWEEVPDTKNHQQSPRDQRQT